jgi:hypothetical protein
VCSSDLSDTLASLHAVASPDEIDRLIGIVYDMNRGYVPAWQVDFVIEIIRRLAARADKQETHG